MRLILISVLLTTTLLAAGCSQPTREDIQQAEQARKEQLEHCLDLRKEMEDNSDRPLIRATIQERYNRDCLGKTYPTPGGGDG